MAIIFQADSEVVVGNVEAREGLMDVYHGIEDQNWANVSFDPMGYNHGADFYPFTRETMLRRIRNIARSNPVAKQMLRLGAIYTFGTGLTVKTVTANDRRFVRPVITRFWSDPTNQQSLTSVQAQITRSIEFDRDGDLFLQRFLNPVNGMTRWVAIDAARVQDIITDPDNIHAPRWYKIKKGKADYNFKSGQYDMTSNDRGNRFYYVKDWRYVPMPGDPTPPATLIGQGVMLHRAINQEGKFGLSDLYSSDDWLTAHKGFMEDRASLTKALHTIAWIVTRDDTPAGVQAAAVNMQSSYANGPIMGFDTHPNPAAGSTLIQNRGSRREPVTVNTGGDNAIKDAESLLQMGAIGGGVFTHYLGSVQAHRLATVTAMELPLLKLLELKQQVWRAINQDILQDAIDCAIRAGVIPGDPTIIGDDGLIVAGPMPDFDPIVHMHLQDADGGSITISGSTLIDRTVQVEFPPILVKDLAGVVNAVRNLADIAPVTIEARKILLSIAFAALGVDDVEKTVEDMFPVGNSPILLPANSIKSNIVKQLPGTGDTILDDEEDAKSADDASVASGAWSDKGDEGE